MSQDRFGHLPRRIADAHHAVGPFSLFNPTTRYLKVPAKAAATVQDDDEKKAQNAPPRDSSPGSKHIAGAYQVWRSRDNRKGRHALVLTRAFRRDRYGKGPKHSPLRGVLHGLATMLVRCPVWDISYDVAVIFTLGSVVWVINSFFVWLPLAAPSTAFAGESTMAGGVSALVGATIFEVGAVLGLLEAVNENRADCFGWAVEDALESGMQALALPMALPLQLRPSPSDCRHAHADHARLFPRDTSPRHPRRWSWWPTAHELRTIYVREMGFWACAIQLVGATVFWISGLTGLPPIFSRLSTAAANGIFWLPQVVGGVGFIVSSALFMLETQRAWYRPAPALLGWHIGAWNLVGAVGFTLCGALGFGATTSDGVEYTLTLSTFIGSWAFLIGSVIQWYESLDKYTIQIRDALPRHVPP